jgi:SPX domain protein involved in polyphosphate accumulation
LHLQKQVKRLPFKDQLGQQGTLETLSEEEANFVKALSDTLNQLNEMFLEKEENSVIRVERLEHELAAATAPEQLNSLHKDFVDFHGEVLLLVHWSILAYTATVKILKKHHKRTGLLVKAPQLGDLLSQPFCSTEVSCGIHRCCAMRHTLYSAHGYAADGAAAVAAVLLYRGELQLRFG